jgi:hypothetical protein
MLIEEFAETWIVVDATNNPTNLAQLLQPVKCGIDRGATSEIQEIVWRMPTLRPFLGFYI